jgi:alkanesulfonate monooxygenase SsuD/methylene tetrahydromethanopterin reductase-like flavin-dependent oxidoreductase (luciferase family)
MHEGAVLSEIRLGVNLWSQASSWSEFLAAGQAADRLGYDHLWTWDHLLPIFGELDQNVHEGYTALAALAQATERIRLGLFVGANTFRNPGLAVKSLVTIDHISGGRAMFGLGGAWFEDEHTAFGIDFGSGFGQRLDWLAEAVPAARMLLDGGTVTSAPGGRYAFDNLSILPRPVQAHLPIVIGGSGEKKTLRIVAQYADMWNAFGTVDGLVAKDDILKAHCDAVGRDESEIERSVGCKVTIRGSEAEAQRVVGAALEHNKTPRSLPETDHTFWTGTAEQVAETMAAYKRIGFGTFIAELPAPYDHETMETLVRVVKPMVDAA